MALIHAQNISPAALVRTSLERADALTPALNCFITIGGAKALRQVREIGRCDLLWLFFRAEKQNQIPEDGRKY